jgi:hypothetical protein
MSHEDEVGALVSFQFVYPMWLLVDAKGLAERGLPASVAVLGGPESTGFIPLFTNADKAKRFLEVMPLPGQSPLAIGTAQLLATILDDFYRRGIYDMAVDFHSSAAAGKHSLVGGFLGIKPFIERTFGKKS